MLKKWWDAFAIVSIAYSISFFLSALLVTPVQAMVFPQSMLAGSLLFLPHGVRVLTAWWLGWRSVAVLLPISLALHYYLVGATAFSIPLILIPIFGSVCAALGFWLVGRMRGTTDAASDKSLGWRWIMGAGLISSVINVAGTSLVNQGSTESAAIQIFGDISGLFILLVVLMSFFRWQRIKM